MAYTVAEKKELSRQLYMAGYSAARAAELLDISDTLIEDYWDEWVRGWTRINSPKDGPIMVTDRGSVLEENGAGAISTLFAPRTYRWIENGGIITEIQVDLTGLGCAGVAQGDVIGLPAGGAAYIGRYVASTYGIVYRIEMACVQAPGEGVATIEPDIDLMADDSGLLEYDDAAVDTVIASARDWVAGEQAVNNVPKLTDSDYLYLGEGDIGGDSGVYSAGQLIIRLFGHPVLLA